MTIDTVKVHDVEDPAYSIVIPIRDRCGHMLRNCLKSVELQTLKPLEIIVVDYGSTDENHEKLMQLLPDCTFYRCETSAIWSLSVARNIGLRRAKARISCAFDADLIMEPRVLEVAHGIHSTNPRIYMSNRVVLLDPAALNAATITLPRDYKKISKARSSHTSEGWGGFVSAPSEWWHECQGFDERMKVWGWEDVDMWKRSARANMARRRLDNAMEEETTIYHLPHASVPIKAYETQDKETIATIRQNERWTKRYNRVLRNDENWGLGA